MDINNIVEKMVKVAKVLSGFKENPLVNELTEKFRWALLHTRPKSLKVFGTEKKEVFVDDGGGHFISVFVSAPLFDDQEEVEVEVRSKATNKLFSDELYEFREGRMMDIFVSGVLEKMDKDIEEYDSEKADDDLAEMSTKLHNGMYTISDRLMKVKGVFEVSSSDIDSKLSFNLNVEPKYLLPDKLEVDLKRLNRSCLELIRGFSVKIEDPDNFEETEYKMQVLSSILPKKVVVRRDKLTGPEYEYRPKNISYAVQYQRS